MPLYFAYGANMDREAMRERCPASAPIGRASLPGHRFLVSERGFASIQPCAGGFVPGVAWHLAWRDLPGLDRFEEVSAGLYVKRHRPVRLGTRLCSALVYVGCHHGRPGIPVEGYMAGVVAAAEAWRLPPDHLKRLRGWLRLSPEGSAPAMLP